MYKIQYKENSQWNLVLDNNGFPIEFLSLVAAKSIAQLLCKIPDYPRWYMDWRIVSVGGIEYSIG